MDGGGKRRQTDQLTKDHAADDDEEPQGADPGAWVADANAIKARRKVHVRRGGQPEAAEAPAAAAAVAPANPFASVTLAPSTNPFAGVLLTPASTAAKATPEQENGGKDTNTEAVATTAEPSGAAATATTAAAAAPEATPAAAEGTAAKEPASETVPAAATGAMGGGFGALGAAAGGNPFASLGGKAFSGFGSAGGGFGALAASGTAFGSFGAASAPATGAAGGLGAFAPSTFSFGTSTFPAVTAAPLQGAAGAVGGSGGAGGAAEGGEEEEDGQGEEGRAVALFDGAPGQPVVSLPEQAKVTGEEEDQVVFSADGVLFEFDSTSNKWHERCKGVFKVNVKVTEDGRKQARMVMRQAANLRLLLNAKVYEGMPLSVMPGKAGVTFGVFNAASTVNQEAGATADASKPADPGQASAGSAAGESGSQGGPSASQGAQTAVKSTTMAVRIKNAELVEKLHSLLCELKTPAAAGQGGDAAV